MVNTKRGRKPQILSPYQQLEKQYNQKYNRLSAKKQELLQNILDSPISDKACIKKLNKHFTPQFIDLVIRWFEFQKD